VVRIGVCTYVCSTGNRVSRGRKEIELFGRFAEKKHEAQVSREDLGFGSEIPEKREEKHVFAARGQDNCDVGWRLQHGGKGSVPCTCKGACEADALR
jgi:hypothetical protein